MFAILLTLTLCLGLVSAMAEEHEEVTLTFGSIWSSDTTLSLKQQEQQSAFSILARRALAGLLSASQKGSTPPGRKRRLLNGWIKLRGV